MEQFIQNSDGEYIAAEWFSEDNYGDGRVYHASVMRIPLDLTDIRDQRVRYAWHLDVKYAGHFDGTVGGPVSSTRDDHQDCLSVCNHGDTLKQTTGALCSLSSFLVAWDEALRYQDDQHYENENAAMFPTSCDPWRVAIEEFALWALDFQEAIE